MFDFDKAIAEAKQDVSNKCLFLILLGSSGNGKSYAQGTFGVKTLYLYTQGESHGPKSASALGGENVIPICIDREGNTPLTADESIKRLYAILDDHEALKKSGIKAISLDGASEIEALIRDTTTFKEKTIKAFSDGPVELSMFREILNRLKTLQRALKIHVCMTCTLNVKTYSEDGTIMESAPSLHGYQVATGLVQQFDDVMVIGRMERKEKVGYRLQLLAGVSKTTADFNTKEVKKTMNFSPRLTGADILSLGNTLDANLATLIDLKKGSK